MLIYLDGLDGVGKTTLAEYIKNKLGNAIIVPMLGAGEVGQVIRKTYLERDSYPKEFDALAVMAAGIEAQYGVIKPAIARGVNVITDRSMASYYAYNVALADNRLARNIFHAVTSDQRFLADKPDIYIYCYATKEAIKKRLANRENDRMDNLPDAAKYKIMKGYEVFNNMAVNDFHWNLKCLNCSGDQADVFKAVDAILEQV